MLANKVEEGERMGLGGQEPVTSLSSKGPPATELVPENCHPMKEELVPFYKRGNEDI